jgi:cephalosporin hydroxylase
MVIGVEIDSAAARANIRSVDPRSRGITLIEGDVTDPALPGRVRSHLPDGARCMVIEDTAHTYDTTRSALDGFAPLVGPGGFFVVEDACVDDDELRFDDWPRGVLPAITDWLDGPEGADFRVRRDLELYGVTCHPSGFLQRRGEPEPLEPPSVRERLRARLGLA